MQISVRKDMKSTKEAIFQKKSQNQCIRSQNTFGIQFQKFMSKCSTRKLQSKPSNTAEKKTHSFNGSNYTHQHNEVKGKL